MSIIRPPEQEEASEAHGEKAKSNGEKVPPGVRFEPGGHSGRKFQKAKHADMLEAVYAKAPHLKN